MTTHGAESAGTGSSDSAGAAGRPAATVLEHAPIVPPRQGPPPEALADDVLASFRTASAADVSDLVGRLYTMDAGIRPLYRPMRRMAGSALTVKAVPGDNWAIVAALGQARTNDVLVVDWHGYHDGCGSGAITTAAAIANGLCGIVIDGAWRDAEEIATLDFSIFGRGTSPYSPAKRELGEINVAVCCGGVVVEAGDLVVGDEDGVAVVPRAHVSSVAAALAPRERRESPSQLVDEQVKREITQRTERYQHLLRERTGG
jgi:4-hydroxy-4-methyl-2-oxoglutarate aldolase